MARRGGWIDHLRLWFTFNEWAGATVLLVAGGSVLSVIVLALLIPTGPATETTGRIELVALRSSKWGSPYRGIIRLNSGLTVDVPLPRRHICEIGDPVVIVFEPRVWGTAVLPKSAGCAA